MDFGDKSVSKKREEKRISETKAALRKQYGRRWLEEDVLGYLTARRVEVECADCARTYEAKWLSVVREKGHRYSAMSVVDCDCGNQLLSVMRGSYKG